ncbi:MAG: TIGR03435 family protein [Bryobacteraceae bacterium]
MGELTGARVQFADSAMIPGLGRRNLILEAGWQFSRLTLREERRINSMNAWKTIFFLVLGSAAVLAQDAPWPEFEVASIRPSTQDLQQGVTAGVRIDGAQFRASLLTLKDYIGAAYRLKLYQISGPDWLKGDRFDIAATLPPDIPQSQIPEMLQRLLEERFQLKTHWDKKELPVYVLEVAKGGLKMQETPPDPEAAKVDPKAPANYTGSGSDRGGSINLGRGVSIAFSDNKFEAKRVTMANLAGTLERFLDRPVVDMTGLSGGYDFTLDVTQEDYRAMLVRAAVAAGVVLPPEALRLLDGSSPASLFDALQKLGLRLDARKAPLDLLVIDDTRKTPTEN